MRRLIAFLCASALVLSSCQRRPNPAEVVQDESAILATGFSMDEPVASSQLLHGFYNLEGAPWRWTKQKFGVVLHVPQPKSKLRLYLTLPGIVLEKTGPITLNASVNLKPLAPETFSKEGLHTYSREVELSETEARIEFETDKVVPAGVLDQRDLALIVSRVELTLP